MGETGKRFHSHRDHDGDRKNQKRRTNDKNQKGDYELIVYRILCPNEVIGSVIGKSGKVINSIRQETRAKVKVMDPFPGAKDWVITIYCYAKEKEDVEIGGEFDDKKPLCPAQDALLKVYAAIVNSMEAIGDSDKKEKNKDECQIHVPSSQSANIIDGGNGFESISSYATNLYGGFPPPSTLDMLFPANAVGKVLGKGGTNIANIRKISGATIEISESRSARGVCIALISGTSEQRHGAENLIQAFIMST